MHIGRDQESVNLKIVKTKKKLREKTCPIMVFSLRSGSSTWGSNDCNFGIFMMPTGNFSKSELKREQDQGGEHRRI